MAEAHTLTVDAGPHNRDRCPVEVPLAWDYRRFKGACLTDVESGKTVPCQLTRVSSRRAVAAWLINGLRASEQRTYRLTPLETPEPSKGVDVVNAPDELRTDVYVHGGHFTSYHYGKQWVRPFLHPVIGPHGRGVTRSWPISDGVEGESQDRPHHKSIWVGYGACNKVNNWSETGEHGWQRHHSFTNEFSGPVYGRLTAKIDWCTHAGRKQFEEIRDMRFHALPGGERLFDFNVTLCMTEARVVFHDTREGGLLAVRAATALEAAQGGCIENGYGGIGEVETWGRRAPWCDRSGTIDGKMLGLAVFDHETNPRYPTNWHVRDYGLMTANCFGLRHYRPKDKVKGDMVFPKGSQTTWRYRVFIHRGDASKGKVKARFLDYIVPPRVTVK